MDNNYRMVNGNAQGREVVPMSRRWISLAHTLSRLSVNCLFFGSLFWRFRIIPLPPAVILGWDGLCLAMLFAAFILQLVKCRCPRCRRRLPIMVVNSRKKNLQYCPHCGVNIQFTER